MSSAQGCCSPHATHTLNGVSYLCGSVAASLALVTVAALVAGIAFGLLAWDGLFVYSIAMRGPMNLFWAVPVTLSFIAVDLLIILQIIGIANSLGTFLVSGLKYCNAKMLHHFRAIGSPQ